MNHNKSINKIIDYWNIETAINIQLHIKSAKYYHKLIKIITIPNIIILAITGTTLLSTISTDEKINNILTIIAGILITISTFIQTLQQFLNWEDKETIHTNVTKLYQLIQQELNKYPIYRSYNNQELLKEYINHIDSINKIITQIKYEPPEHIYLEYSEQVLQTQNIDPYAEIKKISLDIISNHDDSSNNSITTNISHKKYNNIYRSYEDLSSLDSSSHNHYSEHILKNNNKIYNNQNFKISEHNLYKFKQHNKINENKINEKKIIIPSIKLQETALQIENNLKKMQLYAKSSIKNRNNYSLNYNKIQTAIV